MYVHLGQDYIIPMKSIIGIFDMDTATNGRYTRRFIARMESEQKVISAFDDLPRAAVLCETELGEVLYLSQISTAALSQRLMRLSRGQFT